MEQRTTPEILNTILEIFDKIKQEKKSPILDVIEKQQYKIYIVTQTHFLHLHEQLKKYFASGGLLCNGDKYYKEFQSQYVAQNYTTYNNKRRWSIIIFKDNINNIIDKKYNSEFVPKMVKDKILNNKITKYDIESNKDLYNYVMNKF